MIELPKDDKSSLCIGMPYLVLQVFLREGSAFHLEIMVLDQDKTKKRLVFHNGAKGIIVNHLHARIPISCFVLNAWTNISIDISSFLKYCYPGSAFKSIEYIGLKTSCLLRRIFTMNLPLNDDTGYLDEGLMA